MPSTDPALRAELHASLEAADAAVLEALTLVRDVFGEGTEFRDVEAVWLDVRRVCKELGPKP
jgi:hypothetical protein